jgi:hypothetical protein
LRHICGFSKLLEDDSGELLNAAGRQHLQMIQKSGKNMGELIDGLLNMGRIWRQELAYEPTDLNTLIQSVLHDLQPDNSERHIEWHIGELSTVKCDPGLVRQVFANLVSNAVKYTRRRDHAVIEIGELIIEGRSVIFVRDNGAGFDQQYVHKLFGPFQRLHTADEFEGNGVGLATIQSIIRRHGGRIWAEGQVDKGATFFFELLPSSQGEARAEPSFALKVTQ